jgi:hypothetical protein
MTGNLQAMGFLSIWELGWGLFARGAPAGDACHLDPLKPALGRRRGLDLPVLDAARHPRPLISKWAIRVLFNRGTAARPSHCFSGHGGAWARHLVVRNGHPAG